jgi:hypothetical protein
MEYSTADLYWEESINAWYKTSQDNSQYYFHNDIVSSWHGAEKYWSLSFFEAKKKLLTCLWKKVDAKFIRDGVKKSHYKDDYKGRLEYPHARDCDYGNQATTYESSLGKGDKKRFTLILDDDVYNEVVAVATLNNMRRNTYLNTMIRDTIQTEEVSV